ncbi:radical SAM protein [Dethiothermospora halolimnae]|uniref:radical SAM protein n=1 Tax=Dethiothermospora halolimnae TaxID=3114390 RepID=UPI003CCB9D06
MKVKTLSENNNVVLYYPNSSKWLRFNESDFNFLINNYEFSELEEYYNIKSDGYLEARPCYNSVYISMTNKCNLECEFCVTQKIGNDREEQHTYDKELSNGDLEDFIIPYLKEISFNKIIITGGEPLCNTDLLNICRTLSENFGRANLILETNGLLLDKEMAKELSLLVNKIEISIENIMDDIKFKKHIEEISGIIHSLGTQLIFSYVITRKNINSLRKALDFSDENNSYLNYRFVQPFDNKIESLLLTKSDIKNIYAIFIDYLLEDKNKRKMNYGLDLIMNNVVPKSHCNAFGKTIAILPDGRVTICVNLQDEKFQIGKISDYNKIEKNKEQVLNRSNIKELFKHENEKKCKECIYIDFCGGLCISCRGHSHTYDSVECDLRKVIIRYNLFYHSKYNTIKANITSFLNILNEYFDI